MKNRIKKENRKENWETKKIAKRNRKNREKKIDKI